MKFYVKENDSLDLQSELRMELWSLEGCLLSPDICKIAVASILRQNFTTVEVKATFYRLPKSETFENWRRIMPEGWAQIDSCFSIKRSII